MACRGAVTVLVVEDQPVVSRCVCRIVAVAGYRVVAALSLAEARAVLRAAARGELQNLSVVLLDLQLPDGRGEDFLADLEHLHPRPGVAAVTGTSDCARSVGLLAHDVSTIPKPVDPKALLALVDHLATTSARCDPLEELSRAHGLAEREVEVVRLASRGLSNAGIAAQCGCSVGTVGTHWQRVLEKTGLRTRREVLAEILERSRRRSVGT